MTGPTSSTDFPTVNALQPSLRGVQNAFVAKLNPAGSALVYSTYLGGSSADEGDGLAVDSSGNAYVTGTTYSTDFPTANPLQATNHGTRNAFVAKFNATGSALVYSTYLGGSSGRDAGLGIAVDSSGNAYVTGLTGSTDFPIVSPWQARYGGGLYNAFVAKLNAEGSALVYSSYLGGSSYDVGYGIAVDSAGNAYVAGQTESSDFPTVNPLQATKNGDYTTFVTKIAPSCTYSFSATGESFTAVGGLGSFTVTTAPTCPLTLNVSAGWITLSPWRPHIILVGTGTVTYGVFYAVASNTGAARTGSISGGGQTYSINQAGLSCTDTISPTFAAPQDIGGNVSVSVGAPKGCSWTAISNVPWVTVKSGGSGSGGGVVVLNVAPNTGNSRSGTVTIAGQTFSVTQGAGACGALDVTSETVVSRSGLTWGAPFEPNWYYGKITVTNSSGGVMGGPVYLVTLGLPNHRSDPYGAELYGPYSLTTCFSSQGDSLVPVTLGSMQSGQSVTIPLTITTDSPAAPIGYSTKVLSGAPSH